MQKNMFNTTMIDVSIDKLLDRLYKIQTHLEHIKHSNGADVIAVDESILEAIYDCDFEDHYDSTAPSISKQLKIVEGGAQ